MLQDNHKRKIRKLLMNSHIGQPSRTTAPILKKQMNRSCTRWIRAILKPYEPHLPRPKKEASGGPSLIEFTTEVRILVIVTMLIAEVIRADGGSG